MMYSLANNRTVMTDQPQNQPAPPAAPAEPKAEEKKAAPAAVDQTKVLAALSYFGVLFLVPLLLVKNDEFVKFHVKQGIVWFVVWVVVSFISWIPFIGWSIGLALFIISCYAAWQAYEGKRWELPYLAKYAQQIKI